MKKFLVTLARWWPAPASMVAADADARRMGGGGSFGRQSQSVTQASAAGHHRRNRRSSRPRPGRPRRGAAAGHSPASPWKGMLGGALLGLGLGALLSHLGIGGAMASMIARILMIALLALAVDVHLPHVPPQGHRQLNGVRPAYAGA